MKVDHVELLISDDFVERYVRESKAAGTTNAKKAKDIDIDWASNDSPTTLITIEVDNKVIGFVGVPFRYEQWL
jgi:hypothetical protein